MAWSGLLLPRRPLHDTVPVPSVAPNVPQVSLPSWRRLPWDSKLPMPRCPKGEVPLSRGKLCSSAYKSYPHHIYTLYDEHNYEDAGIKEYHPLFDHSLQNYFLNKSHFRILLKSHLITNEGQPICSLSEYNKYRHYLFNLWSLEVDRLEKRQINEERRLLEAEYQDVLKMPYTSIRDARNRWLEYQNELKKEYGKYYHAISKWLQEVSRCYRNAIMIKVARHDAREEQLRQKWDRQYEHDMVFFEEEWAIRRNEEIDLKRRRERRLREFQKQWEAHDRQLANRKAKLKSKVQYECDKTAEIIRKFRAKYAKELDDYEAREGIKPTVLTEESNNLDDNEEGEGIRPTVVTGESNKLDDNEAKKGTKSTIVTKELDKLDNNEASEVQSTEITEESNEFDDNEIKEGIKPIAATKESNDNEA